MILNSSMIRMVSKGFGINNKKYSKDIKIDSHKYNDPKTLNNIGLAYQKEGDLSNAIKYYKKALKINSSFGTALSNLAIALAEKGCHSESVKCCIRGIRVSKNNKYLLTNFGSILRSTGHFKEATEAFRYYLRIEPNNANIHYDLANCYHDDGDLKNAIEAYDSALRIRNNFPEALCNKGLAIHEMGKVKEALELYNLAISHRPDYIQVLNNIGMVMKDMGRIEEAMIYYNKALKLNPSYPEAIANIGIAKLYLGKYKEGWKYYQHRYLTGHNIVRLIAEPNKNRIFNLDNLERKTVLISEQGLGDTIQFIRFGSLIKETSIKLSVCVEEKLTKLIKESDLFECVYTPNELKQIDKYNWAPLLSLPDLLGVEDISQLKIKPYLKVDKQRKEKWRLKLEGKTKKPIIGINWQGNPRAEVFNLKGRSLELELFAELANKIKVSLLGLQKGYGLEQIENCSFKNCFVSCQEEINNALGFQDHAALIANCDLVITSDTCTAHIAGAIGHPTWLLLNKIPDWRWGLAGDKTFWYPSIKIFRQQDSGDWKNLIARLSNELQTLFIK